MKVLKVLRGHKEKLETPKESELYVWEHLVIITRFAQGYECYADDDG